MKASRSAPGGPGAPSLGEGDRPPAPWGQGRLGGALGLGMSSPGFAQPFSVVSLLSQAPVIFLLSQLPSSSCLKFRLWTFPLGVVVHLFYVL